MKLYRSNWSFLRAFWNIFRKFDASYRRKFGTFWTASSYKGHFFPFLFFYFDLWCNAFYFLFVIQSIYEFDHRDIFQHKGHKMVWRMLWSLSLIVTNLVTSNRCIRKSFIIQTLKFLKVKSKIMNFFWNEINDQNLARKWFL